MRIELPKWCMAPQYQPSQLSGLAATRVKPIRLAKRMSALR